MVKTQDLTARVNTKQHMSKRAQMVQKPKWPSMLPSVVLQATAVLGSLWSFPHILKMFTLGEEGGLYQRQPPQPQDMEHTFSYGKSNIMSLPTRTISTRWPSHGLWSREDTRGEFYIEKLRLPPAGQTRKEHYRHAGFA